MWKAFEIERLERLRVKIPHAQRGGEIPETFNSDDDKSIRMNG